MGKKIQKRGIKKFSKKESWADRVLSFSLKPAFSYLEQIKIYILIVIILFFLSSIFGYFDFIGKISPELSNKLNEQIIKSVQDIINQTQGLTPIELIGFIMVNNIKTAFLGVIFGMFFGIVPLIVALFNGYVLGFVAERAVTSPLNDIGALVLWRLFPHGIFEIPAILIGISLGIKLGTFPFYVKEKVRAFFALLLSFVVFIVTFSLISLIFIIIKNPGLIISGGLNAMESSYENILGSPILMYVFIILSALFYVISILIGLNILPYKDRKIVYENIVNSIKTFIFIIIPLLVIAGIIEGILIAIMG